MFTRALANMITGPNTNSTKNFSLTKNLQDTNYGNKLDAIVFIRYHNRNTVNQMLEIKAITKELAEHLGEERKNESIQVVVSSLSTSERYIFLVTGLASS